MFVVPTTQVVTHCHNNPRKLIHKISIIYFFKMKFILCLPLLKYKLHNPKAGIFFFFSYFILGH